MRCSPGLRTLFRILASGACYYLATRVAWVLCFPDSKVSLFFPPHAILVSILLLVPTRHWWAYTLAAAAVISSPRSRRIGRLSMHCTARPSMP